MRNEEDEEEDDMETPTEPNQKKTKGEAQVDKEFLQEEDTPEPDKTDFAAWLRWKKNQWKRMRLIRKLRREEALPSNALGKVWSSFPITNSLT